MAEHHAQEWKRERGGEDTIGFNKEISSICALRVMHVEEARERAGNLDFSKSESLSRPRRLDRLAFKDIALLSLTTLWTLCVTSSDNVLSNWQYQPSHFCNFWFCWARKSEGAEQSPSYTPRIASSCVWSQHTSVKGMSSLLVSGDSARKGNSALRAHVAKAPGIELANREGQNVIHGTCANSTTA